MEISIRKPNTNVKTKVDKEALKRHKIYEKAIQQAKTMPVASPVVYPKYYIPTKLLFKYSLYAIGFLSWFVSWYFSY